MNDLRVLSATDSSVRFVLDGQVFLYQETSYGTASISTTTGEIVEARNPAEWLALQTRGQITLGHLKLLGAAFQAGQATCVTVDKVCEQSGKIVSVLLAKLFAEGYAADYVASNPTCIIDPETMLDKIHSITDLSLVGQWAEMCRAQRRHYEAEILSRASQASGVAPKPTPEISTHHDDALIWAVNDVIRETLSPKY